MITSHLVIYFPDGGGWVAEAPDLPGCQTCGKTLDQARQGIKEAIQGWIEVAQADGDPIPEPSRILETVSVNVLP